MLLAAFVLLIGWLISVTNRHNFSLDYREENIVTKLVQESETRYFGFYSVNLPVDFSPKGMVMRVHGSDMTIVDTKLQYYYGLKQFLSRYEEELRNTTVSDLNDLPYLKDIYCLEPPTIGAIFERVENKNTPDFARTLDAWKWEDDITFSVKMLAQDGRAARYDGVRKIAKYSYRYDVPEKKRQLLAILSGLQSRKNNNPPSEHKFAIQFAQVDVSLLGEYEISVNYENNKDISLAMQTDNGRYTDRILLESNICSIGATSCLTLYKGKRNINGLEVSEWLINQKTLVTTYPTLEYIFELAIHEDKKDGHSPLKLSMYYKVDLLKPDGMLSEAELVSLWQHITRTIKYNPPDA